jgi:hypothetical protein
VNLGLARSETRTYRDCWKSVFDRPQAFFRLPPYTATADIISISLPKRATFSQCSARNPYRGVIYIHGKGV